MKRLVIAGISLVLFIGCTKANTPKAEKKATTTKSTTQTLIGGFTGQTAVKAGQRAKADITRISEQRNRDLDAVME